VKTLVPDDPSVAKTKTMQYAGRVGGGDFKWTFDNAVDDAAYLVNAPLKTAISNYATTLVFIQGESNAATSSQTLTCTTKNNNQTVVSGTAISSIVFTWGGDATDATVTGLPALGIDFVKDATAKTITISGTPTDTVSYSIATIGATGTPAAGSGTIMVTSSGASSADMVQNFTLSGKTSTFYTITGNLTTSYGSATYAGLTLTQALKMESTTNIAFTTTTAGTLTLVYGSTYTGTIKVDGTTYTPSANAGIVSISLTAGAHTIIKGSGSNYLFYMSVVYAGIAPTITGTTPGSRCGSGTVVLGATASTGTINWYSALTGGSSLGTGTSFTTPNISVNTNYYVDATYNGSTTATRTLVLATVNGIPTITMVTPGSRCDAGTVTLNAVASSGTINWYSASTGGSSLGTGVSFTTPGLNATTSYYVDATENNCFTASRTAVTATINSTPAIISTTSAVRSGAGSVILNATASDGIINWYLAPTGGTSLGTGNSFTTPNIIGTTSFFVDATANSCITATRTEVVATVNTTPSGINNVQNAGVTLSPNPVTENLNITADFTIEEVEIYSLTGVLIKSAKTNFKSINTSDLKQGCYIVRVHTVYGVCNFPIIKE
jgi:hypothetical protein